LQGNPPAATIATPGGGGNWCKADGGVEVPIAGDWRGEGLSWGGEMEGEVERVLQMGLPAARTRCSGPNQRQAVVLLGTGSTTRRHSGGSPATG
jgi:hypothetical protein